MVENLVQSLNTLRERYTIKGDWQSTVNTIQQQAEQCGLDRDFEGIFTFIREATKKNPDSKNAPGYVLCLMWQICLDETTPLPVEAVSVRKRLLFEKLHVSTRDTFSTDVREALVIRMLSAFRGIHPDIFLDPTPDISLQYAYWHSFFKNNPAVYSRSALDKLHQSMESLTIAPSLEIYNERYRMLVQFKHQQEEKYQARGCFTKVWDWVCMPSAAEETAALLSAENSAGPSKKSPHRKF